jgi:hypothetical protein
VAQPGTVQPARPWRPCPPHARTPPPDPFLSFDFSRAVTSISLFYLSLSPWCPRPWNDDRRSLDPRGELPSPPLLSLSLLPLPFFFPARPPCPRPYTLPLGLAPRAAPRASLGRARRAPPCPSEPLPTPGAGGSAPARAPLPRRARPPPRAPASRPCPGGYALVARLVPRPGPPGRALAVRPRPCPRLCPRVPLPELVPRQPRAPRACTVRVPLARSACSRARDVVALRSTLVLIHFNF